MIKIKVANKRFTGVYAWSDLSLRKFCELAAIPMPDGYEAYILADGKYDHTRQDTIDYYLDTVSNLTDKQINEDFPAYYRKVCKCLSNVPDKYLTDELVLSLYDWHFRPFVLTLIYHAPVIHFIGQIKDYEPDQVRRFKIGRNRFYVPQVVNDVPLAKEPIVSYTEASDIFHNMTFSKEDIKRLSLFMAIYCRKKNETYDEASVLERQEMFMNVPMSVVWGVFFYTLRRLPGSAQTTRLFGGLPRRIQEIAEAVRHYRNLAIEV